MFPVRILILQRKLLAGWGVIVQCRQAGWSVCSHPSLSMTSRVGSSDFVKEYSGIHMTIGGVAVSENGAGPFARQTA